MARSYTTPKGITLKRPGVVTDLEVAQGASGVALNGVIFLVGEADSGPHWSEETDLSTAYFGPDQRAEVEKKYSDGRLVHAYRAAVQPSNDPAVTGAPNRIYLVKTNQGTRATGTLTKVAGGTYHTLSDKSWGLNGNLIYWTVTSKTAEVIPTTGSFTLLVPNNSTNINLRANGGAALALTLAAGDLPPANVTAINGLSGVACTGGTDRAMISAVSGTLALDATGNSIVLTRSIAWNTTPTVGDTLWIPSGSVVQGATNANRGSYVITAVSSTTVTATKLLDASGAAGALTAPEDVSAQAIAAVTDAKAYAPVVITLETADVIDGAGKALEVNELTSATGRFTDLAYQLNTTKVTWVSTSASPKILTSSAEYAVYLNINRQLDNVSERVSAGGDIALAIGYTGTTATLTISSTGLTTSVAGGSGANLSISFGTTAKPTYPTLADLANYINAQTGYSCVVGTTALGQKSPFMLDEVSAIGICSTHGGIARPGRVKVDAAKFFDAVATSSIVQLGNTTATNVPAAAGLPALATTTAYLAGGARGTTTDATFQAAIDALEKLRGNFVVPLFSQDATADVTAGETASGSTYTIDAINSYAKSHCVTMSGTKRRRERSAICSLEGTFSAAKTAAQTLASDRAAIAIQQVQTVQSAGIQQDQPWMAAVLAAGMQAAAFTGGGILQRQPNITGAFHTALDFDPLSDTPVEEALESGLLVLTKTEDDRWVFESDQTTWSRDANFYYNSIRAHYVVDIVKQTVRQEMHRLGIGNSIVDFDAATAKAALTGVLDNMRRLKALAPSADAPAGYRNASVRLNGYSIEASVELKFADVVQFISITFSLGEVQQSA